MTPSKMEYDLGVNRHGQRVRFVKEGEALVLLRDPANQRDDSARIEMTPDQMRVLGDITGEIL